MGIKTLGGLLGISVSCSEGMFKAAGCVDIFK